MGKPEDIKHNYIGNIYGELEPLIGDCAIPYCRKDINLGDEYFQDIHSENIFCSYRCVTIQRGPVFRDPTDLSRYLPRMVEALKDLGACTLLVNPRWEDDDADRVETILCEHGFAALPHHQQPMHTTTALIDLTRSEDEILAGFKGSCRRQIRNGERKGLQVRHAEMADDVVRFDTLYQKFAAAKNLGTSGRPPVVAQVELVKRLGGVFLLAELGEQLVGGFIVLREHKRAFWSILASDPDVNLPRGFNLMWAAMREMKLAGCETFDMAGLPDLRDEPADDESAKNRERFKMGFVPRRVRLVRTHILPIRPFSHGATFPARQLFRRLRS